MHLFPSGGAIVCNDKKLTGMEALLAWAAQKGIFTDGLQRHADREFVASRDLLAGEELVQVPQQALVTVKRACERGDEYSEMLR